MIEIRRNNLDSLHQKIAQGEIFVIRQVPEVFEIRRLILSQVKNKSACAERELVHFYEGNRIPSISTHVILAQVLLDIRNNGTLSKVMSRLIHQFNFPKPIKIDGGIVRVSIPSELIVKIEKEKKLPIIAFRRQKTGSETEIFMKGKSNIHRDFNRPHFLLQCNMWFPLHDVDSDSSLQIYPGVYNQDVYNMPLTEENISKLGKRAVTSLSFGDILLFHGEHIHHSPISSRCRHSFDFRIAADCFDDNSHYRDNFWDLTNFTGEVTNFDLFRRFTSNKANPDMVEAVINQLLCPERFSEDTYCKIAEEVMYSNVNLAEKLLVAVVEQSNLWFWVMKASILLSGISGSYKVKQWLSKALKLAKKSELCRYMPVSYEGYTRNQLLPKDAIEILTENISSNNKLSCDKKESK